MTFLGYAIEFECTEPAVESCRLEIWFNSGFSTFEFDGYFSSLKQLDS